MIQAGAYRSEQPRDSRVVSMVCFDGDFCSLRAAERCGVRQEHRSISLAPLLGEGIRGECGGSRKSSEPFFSPELWKISQLSVQICQKQLMQRFTLETACSLHAKESLNTPLVILEEKGKAGLSYSPNCLQLFAILNMVFADIFNMC